MLLVLLLGLATFSFPVFAGDMEIRPWNQFRCEIKGAMPPDPALPGEYVVVMGVPFPLAEDWDQSVEAEGGTQSLFLPPGRIKVDVITPDGMRLSGEAADRFLAEVDGYPEEPDFAAIAGFNTEIVVGDWFVSEVFVEWMDANGNMVSTPLLFPTSFDAATASQCAVTWTNVLTLEPYQVFGEVGAPLPFKQEVRVQVTHGDAAGFAQAMAEANQRASLEITVIEFVGEKVPTNLSGLIDAMAPDDATLFDVKRCVRINGNPTFVGGGFFSPTRFARVWPGVDFILVNQSDSLASFRNWATKKDGGVIDVLPGGILDVAGYEFAESSAGESGGAIAGGHGSNIRLTDCSFFALNAEAFGGAVYFFDGLNAIVDNCSFVGNTATLDGCDVYSESTYTDLPPVRINGSQFEGNCDKARIVQSSRRFLLKGNTINTPDGATAVKSDPLDEAADRLQGALDNIFFTGGQPRRLALEAADPRTETLCEGGMGLMSFGHNVVSDESCPFDQPTDLAGTDPLLSDPDADGHRAPLPGSPAIDHGPAGLVDVAGQPTLPCGWRDIKGLGRPQDGDGDGGFECDAGAVEVQGAGAVQAGHSGAFFNSQRNGEGEYVEVLEGGRTVIYTFTYSPAGDGPAWFIGVGDVAGNSLVTEDLLRPEGTFWGDAFHTTDIDFADWGGMSMVFPACAMGEAPGNVAFSGNENAGFEPLITAAERLTDVLGCGPATDPHPNAGLSGSFFDPARNGEGLVIQYLPDGRVLAIMFTYGPDGRQMWMFGVAEASDKTVTMEVVYPTGFTAWGGAFDPEDVALEAWGTWTLTWTGCDTLVFEYNSSVDGYGSGTRNYARLTKLLGSECPAF
jgi:hypothetical protein